MSLPRRVLFLRSLDALLTSVSLSPSFLLLRNVPYNALLDIGYKSIGDWHSTAAPSTSTSTASHTDDSERAGRWAGNKAKTECGLHKDYSAMKANFELKRAREEGLRLKDEQKDLVAPEVSV